MKKILITDSVDKKAVAVLTGAGFDVHYQPGMPPGEIIKIIGGYHALIVRSDTKVTAGIISAMDAMEVIGRAGTGVDNIDANAATRKGVIVMNTPGGNTISTAEHAISLLLSMCRNIPQADASVKSGKWDRKSFKGTEVYGKTLGVIGLGKIGREVAIRLKAFGMNVIGYDPVLSEDIARSFGVTPVSLEDIFTHSDIITVHVPLDEKTKHLFNAASLKKCKRGVKLVNCARGGIIDEAALVDALNEGQVSAAAFDVYEKEPPDFSHPLFSHPKVVTTPHLGASTDEAQEKVAIQIAEQIADYFKTKVVRGAINAAAVEAAGNPDLLPFISLAEKMGLLHSQMADGKLRKISIEYAGSLVGAYTTVLSTAVLKGFLASMVPEPLNFINTPYIAKDMGITTEERRAEAHPDYQNYIAVSVVTESGEHLLGGTVFGSHEAKIVLVDCFRLELRPQGDLLFYTNADKPGMLAGVGAILAADGLNIAGLSLGRLGVGGEALTIINLDSPASGAILGKISALDGVKSVFSAKL